MAAESFASTLRKILQAEARRGFDDSTVLGGLDRYLARSFPPLGGAHPSDFPVLGTGYSVLGTDDRQAWAGTVVAWLDAVSSAPLSAGRGKPVELQSADLRSEVRASTISGPTRVGVRKPARADGQATIAVVHSRDPGNRGESGGPPRTRTQQGRAITPREEVRYLPGVGQRFAEKLARLGVETVRDLLFLFPRRHVDYSLRVPIALLQPGVEQTIIGVLWQATEKRLGRRSGAEALIGDDTGNIRAVWFNQPHIARTLAARPQAAIALSGKVTVYRGQPMFEAPEYEILDGEDDERIHTGRLVPLYPGTEGLAPRTIRRLVKTALDRAASQLIDPLPTHLLRKLEMPPLSNALWAYHYPDSTTAQEIARRRLAFEELFLIQLGLASQRRERQQQQAPAIRVDAATLAGFLGSLPFPLTGAQRRALDEILDDIQQSRPMSRLLQGDVGSGKTVIAAAAFVLAIRDGMQGALMAPTEILAEQHYRNLCALLEHEGGMTWDNGYLPPYLSDLGRSVKIALLVGSLTQREKENVRTRIAAGQVDLVIGTQALIQEGVSFHHLGLAVVDEQHRFGVAQRWTLRQKGESPHVLVMTATPIPRTLALTVYGDLDVSVLDEMPPGRRPIVTRWLKPSQRRDAYDFVRDQILEGRQVFVVCPLVEESDVIEARAATVEYERLTREVFPDLRLGLLHGRMSAHDKDAAMRAFRDGAIDVLVSTAVVEVGIDVPNATVMLIEGADRFGLAQLHQFRGRVGRGAHQSYCLLLADGPSLDAQERLAIVQRTQDGFVLAEEDLRLRGPGEFFGTRQTGLPAFRLARLTDHDLLEMARDEAQILLATDPELTLPEHGPLAQARDHAWRPGAGDLS